MVYELDRAQRVRDRLDGVGQTMRKVVHRVDAPLAAGPVVRSLLDPVQDRIPHREHG